MITTAQIESLPVNGRNFLDIAQIEPGVILQAGSSFDPTKAGYSAISVGGVSGRTTRILLDGQDITDETVGTTILNVSQGAIGDFQLNRSTQDASGEVTSTGQVLVSTRAGGQSRGQIVDAISISERPAEIEDRAIPGHWEGDLLSGTGNSHIATLVERHSRFTILVKVPSKDTATVVDALTRQVRKLPASLRRSLTWTEDWRWPNTKASQWPPK